MSIFHPVKLLDSYAQYLYRETDFLELRPCSFHFPLAYAVQSLEDNLAFDFDILFPSTIPFDLPSPCCLHRHHCNHRHLHHYHPLLLSGLPPYFIDAAVDLRRYNQDASGLGDRLTLLEQGLDRAFCARISSPERKWKWTAKIKRPKGSRLDHKFKCTKESKGAFEKSMKCTVNFQGKGEYAPLSRTYKFHVATAVMHDGCEKAKTGKEAEGEVVDETDQKFVSIRQALAKRSVAKIKGKKKELSPQDAAISIQKTFRDYKSRRSRTLGCLRDLAAAKAKLKEIRGLFSRFSYRHRLTKDAEERQRFSEKISILLLTIDAIEGADFMARSAKRSMTHELERVLDLVDPQSMGQRKFDLPAGSLSMEMVSGVADVIHMLNQDPVFSL